MLLESLNLAHFAAAAIFMFTLTLLFTIGVVLAKPLNRKSKTEYRRKDA